jgi:hypothetical protein
MNVLRGPSTAHQRRSLLLLLLLLLKLPEVLWLEILMLGLDALLELLRLLLLRRLEVMRLVQGIPCFKAL